MPSENANPIESVIVVSGTPGSGKTTLARQLAVVLELPLISKDVIKEALDGPLIVADTSRPVDISELTKRIRAVA